MNQNSQEIDGSVITGKIRKPSKKLLCFLPVFDDTSTEVNNMKQSIELAYGEDMEWCLECSLFSASLPLRSYSIETLIRAGFSVGRKGYLAFADKYLMINFSRWIENEDGKLRKPPLPSFQITFTRFGVAITKNLETIYTPNVSIENNQPVLIYDYDSEAFIFCDVSHFVTIEQAMTYVYERFSVEKPPCSEPLPNGKFESVFSYMQEFIPEGSDLIERPVFYNT